MAPAETTRRRLLSVGGLVLAGGLAGCSGDSSIDEIESDIQAAMDELEAVERPLTDITTAVDGENWSGCLGEVEGIRNHVDSARESLADAIELAEDGGHSDHVTVITRMQEYAAILESMADEIQAACEAGQAGDRAAFESHWETVQALDDDRQAKREEVEDALDAIR